MVLDAQPLLYALFVEVVPATQLDDFEATAQLALADQFVDADGAQAKLLSDFLPYGGGLRNTVDA